MNASSMATADIHHVTAIAGDPSPSVEFETNFLETAESSGLGYLVRCRRSQPTSP